ncbi:AraC family transcriptional regulator [Blautia schinkii]|nr:AraC family transcriptional regulator [Blautia schinkii]
MGSNTGNKIVIVDENLLERIQYQSNSLPISTCADFFDNYLNGEFNYHWHEEFEFGLVLKGSVEYHITQGKHEYACKTLKQGEGVFVNTKALHMARQLEPDTQMFDCEFPSSFFSFQMSGPIYKKNILPIIKLPVPGIFLSPENEKEREMIGSLYELHKLAPDTLGYELKCIELVCQIWRELLSLAADMKDFPKIQNSELIQEQRIRAMLSFIHTHYGEDISIDSIAEAANVSRSECFRCFKEIIRKTPIEYLCEYRLSRAAQLLAGTDETIFHISYSCGFNSASYFSKLFKEKCGLSPGQFRQSTQKIQIRKDHD